MAEITIDPVARVEGHLKMKVDIDDAGTVTAANVTGNLYRDFENILKNRHPWDAVRLTQRICGVCPVSHALSSAKAIEASQGFVPTAQALLLRALIQGSNFLQDHILHFYHLSVMDYIAGPAMSPWAADTPDLRFSAEQTATLTQHYLTALQIRREGQEMGAILAGKLPHVASIHPGGVTKSPTRAELTLFGTYLSKITAFVEQTYRPDVELLASVYADYFDIGRGPGNFVSLGAFNQPNGTYLFAPGTLMGGVAGPAPDLSKVREFVGNSYYSNESGLAPSLGETVPDIDKAGAYTWMKAPRYDGAAIEVGPLARMTIAGLYSGGVSAMDRIKARALETSKIAAAMKQWVAQVVPGRTALTQLEPKLTGSGIGFTEAPRGSLAHWVQYTNKLTTRYQIITPTCWNASPKDDAGLPGALEQALTGVQVADASRPVELLRIVHSFDPCLGCAVHVSTTSGALGERFVIR